MRRLGILFILSILVCALLRADEDITVTAEGRAACATSQAECRHAALADALRRAVENAVGVLVEARTSTKNFQLAQDTIRTTSDGFVRGYRILDEHTESGICTVKIEARVAPGRPEKSLRSICRRLREELDPTFRVEVNGKTMANELSAHGLRVIAGPTSKPAITIKGSVEPIPLGEPVRETGIFSADATTDISVEASGLTLPSVNMSLDKPVVAISQDRADRRAVEAVSRLWIERNVPLIAAALLEPEEVSDWSDLSDVSDRSDGSDGAGIGHTPEPLWIPVEGPRLVIPSDALGELAAKLKASVIEKKEFDSLPADIVVSRFKGIGISDPAAVEDILEDLSTALAKTGVFELVERSQLDKVLAELRIQNSGLVDSATAKKLGKLVGAKAVLVGSVSDRKACYVINARLINTETGRVRIAESVVIDKEPEPRVLRADSGSWIGRKG